MIRFVLFIWAGFLVAHTQALPLSHHPSLVTIADKTAPIDSLPKVLMENHADLMEGRLRHEAYIKFIQHQLPSTTTEWASYRDRLKKEVIKKAGIVIDHTLPLNYQETGTVNMEGFTIKNIAFQTRPGVYATANLYIPNGKGPFPAVINMHGHWREGRLSESVRALGHTLALNGYVCLNIDAMGSGERTTAHGTYEYHGANLGASLMNIGETLLGFQVSDNMRGVDLLSSLPYVDAKNIGATGASGGGNQTMWLTAIDERIKATMPVVSVGTFEAAVMRSNCICELMVDGLTLAETSGILTLISPRALKMCNHKKDSNPTFFPDEMLRSYRNVMPVYKMLGVEKNLSYQLLDLEHGYWPEDREVMLGWFDLHLKGTGNGTPKKETPFKINPEDEVMVYGKGKRASYVESIVEYCKRKGGDLRSVFLNTKTFHKDTKKKELREMLRLAEKPVITKIHQFASEGGWDKKALQLSDGKVIPLLLTHPRNKSGEYTIVCHAQGKDHVSPLLLKELQKKGSGIVLMDLTGTGEIASKKEMEQTKIPLHTLSRSELWLGRTILGEWANELDIVSRFLASTGEITQVNIDGSKEAGLAALFLAAMGGEKVARVTLRNSPMSYLLDSREVDYFSMGIHVPGILNWGDVSLAAALSDKEIQFIDPVTMSGKPLTANQLEAYLTEFEKIRKSCGGKGQTVYKPSSY